MAGMLTTHFVANCQGEEKKCGINSGVVEGQSPEKARNICLAWCEGSSLHQLGAMLLDTETSVYMVLIHILGLLCDNCNWILSDSGFNNNFIIMVDIGSVAKYFCQIKNYVELQEVNKNWAVWVERE